MKYRQLIRVKRMMKGSCEHEVRVTCINGRYHVRVLTDGEVNQEAVCQTRAEIGFTARSLLRWEDKCGNISELATSARARHSEIDFG